MSTNSLTERYVHEVVRRIPADQRDDIADELRTTIADTVEAHDADGRDTDGRDTAEREVLTEMGDPTRLADRYTDRPQALIGPELYPSYLRLLMFLLSAVLPVVTVVFVAIDVVDDKDLGSAIGTAVTTVLTVGAQMIAWLTVVFALLERSRCHHGTAARTHAWTPDDLPDDPPERRRSDKGGAAACAWAAAVWNVLLLGLVVWQHIAEPYRLDGAGGHGERMQVLDPNLWSGWIWPVLVGLAGIAVLDLVRAVARAWTLALATWFALAHALFALPLAWILYRHMFFDPTVLADFNGPDWQTPDAFYTVTALVVLAVSASQVIKRFREARGR